MRYCPSCHSVYPNDFRTCPKDQAGLLIASELQAGMVLRGKYEILGKLGAGGMAAVYRARHLAFGEVRAIKVVNNRLSDDEDFLRRFRNEAIVARRLQHPNAVRVDDLDTTEDGRPFIVMEYVEGRNLRETIRQEGALGLRRSVLIARQVASALAAAHALGIIHRDIKPDNILLEGAGETESAKVLDFGIAKMKEGALGDSGAVATRTGMVVGTPQYISPEQAMGRRGSELDGRADLYSLGVVLYEMVTGRLPFESDTAMGLILHHLQTPPPVAHVVHPGLGIPDPLSAVLLRALEKDREKRFASAAEMAGALDEVLALPLVEREASAPGRPGRALTPPVPFDIDRHETRVMPKTPPITGRAPFGVPGVPAAAAAPSTPPTGFSTPAPVPTLGPTSSSTWTPVPSTTVVTAPPPLPPSATVMPPPPARPRRKRRWWLWIAAAGVLFAVTHRDSSKSRSRKPTPPPPAASTSGEGEGVDSDAQHARDLEMQSRVERALRANPRTRRQDIDVEVDEGIVALSGHAPAAAAREAERMARQVDGVRSVVNVIEVEREEAGGAEAPPPPDGPHIPLVIPSMPPPPRGRPPADPEAVQRLLREAREALRTGDAGQAMGKFGAVLGMDPHNEEARQGMKDATILLGETIRRRVMKAPSPSP